MDNQEVHYQEPLFKDGTIGYAEFKDGTIGYADQALSQAQRAESAGDTDPLVR